MTRVNWMTICSRSVPSGVVLRIFSIAPCARATMNCVCSATVSSRNCLNSFICGELACFLNSARLVHGLAGICVWSSQAGKRTFFLRMNSSRAGKLSSKGSHLPTGNQMK